MEPSRQNLQIVRAIIPAIDNPNMHVVDAAGRYPSAEEERGTRPEHLLDKIGMAVISRALSADIMISRENISSGSNVDNVVGFRTKPIDSEHTLGAGYMWREVEGQANA